jgi:hypothetical protein
MFSLTVSIRVHIGISATIRVALVLNLPFRIWAKAPQFILEEFILSSRHGYRKV